MKSHCFTDYDKQIIEITNSSVKDINPVDEDKFPITEAYSPVNHSKKVRTLAKKELISLNFIQKS